jgi:hypothetical protein
VLLGAYYRAGTGVDVNLRRAEPHPHAGRRAKLTGHDESRAPTAQEEY